MHLEDFCSSNPKERLQIYHNFDRIVEAYFENSTEKTKILAALLVLKRTVNMLTKIFATKNKELPLLFRASTQMIWNYLSGECSELDFAAFSKAFTSYYDYLNNYFDQSVLKQYPAFIEQYDGKEAYHFITEYHLIALVEAIDDVCGEIVTHERGLQGIGNDYLLNELAELAAFAEKIDVGHPEYYRYHELDARDEHLCQTASFGNVMQYICEDFHNAVKAEKEDFNGLAELWREYEGKIFFSEGQLAWLYKYFLY